MARRRKPHMGPSDGAKVDRDALAAQALKSRHFAVALANAVRDLVRGIVQAIYPQYEFAWPLLHAGIAWEVYLLPNCWLAIIVRDHGFDMGGRVIPLNEDIGIRPAESGEEWFERLRARFRLTDTGALVIAPLYIVSEDAKEILRVWLERHNLNLQQQVVYSVAHHAHRLRLPRPPRTASALARIRKRTTDAAASFAGETVRRPRAAGRREPPETILATAKALWAENPGWTKKQLAEALRLRRETLSRPLYQRELAEFKRKLDAMRRRSAIPEEHMGDDEWRTMRRHR